VIGNSTIYILLSIKTRIETATQGLINFIQCIYILLSIKTRIETLSAIWICYYHHIIYILLSIKTRIETPLAAHHINLATRIYILLSIKTRIETSLTLFSGCSHQKFISYYPLKQGLKQTSDR